MATYHLRVKNDTKSDGGKVSAKRHADYILREDGKSHADYINREGAQSDRNDCIYQRKSVTEVGERLASKIFLSGDPLRGQRKSPLQGNRVIFTQ